MNLYNDCRLYHRDYSLLLSDLHLLTMIVSNIWSQLMRLTLITIHIINELLLELLNDFEDSFI
jgi:hypothetical protein